MQRIGAAPAARPRARQRLVLDRLGHLAQRGADRREAGSSRNEEPLPTAPTTSVSRRPIVEPSAPPSERAERDRAPDDEAHHGVHPPLQARRADRLPEADLRDVVDDDHEAEQDSAGDEERDRESAGASAIKSIAGRFSERHDDRRRADAEPRRDPRRRERGDQRADVTDRRSKTPIAPGDSPSFAHGVDEEDREGDAEEEIRRRRAAGLSPQVADCRGRIAGPPSAPRHMLGFASWSSRCGEALRAFGSAAGTVPTRGS